VGEHPSCIIEWRDDDDPWAEHDAEWLGSRVPIVGEYIEVEGITRKVTAVLWGIDGSCVVRLAMHPR
jgi:hypothetical protein